MNIYILIRYNGQAVIYFPHKTLQQQPSLRPGYQYMPGREKQMKNISGVLNRYVILAKNLRVFNEASRYECVFENYFSYFSTKTYVVGTQKNRLNNTVLLSTQNACLN